MNILIVGNCIKDVYLSIDSRTETLETDRNNIKWLSLSFDASKHRYFHRISNFGGAAVSLEVLTKMGISATINNSDFFLSDDENSFTPPQTYRYILTLEDSACYLTPTKYTSANFVVPDTEPDYLFIDRSANLDLKNVNKIKQYLDEHKNVNLILYLKDLNNRPLNSLIDDAKLIFAEGDPVGTLDQEKTIFVTDHTLVCQNITESITVTRIDKLTHLSAYSIAAATVLGGFLQGKTIEKSLKLARANLENSSLDSCLSLKELEDIASNPTTDLELIAANLMGPKKGILAADESNENIRQKFETLNIPNTYENRHAYRNLFFATPDIEQYLNGIILSDEGAHDTTDTGEPITDYLISRRIMPGIRIDHDLTSLETKLREYTEMGLYFAKRHAFFRVTSSPDEIETECDKMANYAKKCQSAGLVPIVEPEVIYDDDYLISDNAFATSMILDILFKKLTDYGVNLRACIMKCNMILAGKQSKTKSTPEEVGSATAKVLKEHVLAELAGIVFLSGGQTPEQATNNLAAIVKSGPYPWPVSFSFARAIKDPALEAWHGEDENIEKARQVFLDRLISNTEIL